MSMRLFDAIRSFRYQQILMLLKRGVDIDVKNKKGQTCLMIICGIKNIESSKRLHMFRFLLKQRAEPLEADSNGKSVFNYACEGGHDSIINVILRIYNPNAVNHIGKDKNGRTAMHFAVMSGKVSTTKLVFRLFHDRFLSVDVPDNCGSTPLIEARKLGFDDVADFLQKTARANPHICDTAFHRNADDWAREASKRRRERVGAEIRKRREQKLIYPRGRIKMRRLPTMLELTQAAFPRATGLNRPMDIQTQDATLPHKSDSIHDVDKDVIGQTELKPRRAIDSALSLLELSSKVNERGYHVTTFVTSHSVPHRLEKEATHHLPAMFNVYASQLSPSFYKQARIPEKPEKPEKRSKRTEGNSKLSTLAVIHHRGKLHPHKKLTRQFTSYSSSEENKVSRKPERRGSEGSLVLNKQPILPGIRVEKPIEEEVET